MQCSVTAAASADGYRCREQTHIFYYCQRWKHPDTEPLCNGPAPQGQAAAYPVLHLLPKLSVPSTSCKPQAAWLPALSSPALACEEWRLLCRNFDELGLVMAWRKLREMSVDDLGSVMGGR